MEVRSGQSVTTTFTTSAFATGALTDATGTPVGTLYLNGTADAATVTVTNITTGRYKAQVTLPTLAVGDVVNIIIAATVSGVAGGGKIWEGSKSVFAGAIPDVAAGGTNGLLINGTNTGTVTLAALTVTGAFIISDGLLIQTSTTNKVGLTVTGNGTGYGISCQGGTTGSGAIFAAGGSSNGYGIIVLADGTGHGIYALSGNGATGDGIHATSQATNGNGLRGVGTGTGDGFHAQGGATGRGIHAVGGATSGAGFRIEGTNGNANALELDGHNTGFGLSSDSLSITGAAAIGSTFTVTGGIVSNITGNLSGSVGSVTGAVGSVTGNVGGNVTGTVGGVIGTIAVSTITASGAVAFQSTLVVTGASTFTGGISANITGNITGNLSGSVGSVTGSVGSVTGAVGSVTGNVGGNVQGNVVGSVASVSGAVGSVTGNMGGDVAGKVLGGGAGTITGDGVRATSVTGNIGGNVAGSDGSVTGAVGTVTGNVGGNVVGTVASIVTVTNIVTAVLAGVVEAGFSVQDVLKGTAAFVMGKASGAGTATVIFRDLSDTLDRITMTVDASGNRGTVTRNFA